MGGNIAIKCVLFEVDKFEPIIDGLKTRTGQTSQAIIIIFVLRAKAALQFNSIMQIMLMSTASMPPPLVEKIVSSSTSFSWKHCLWFVLICEAAIKGQKKANLTQTHSFNALLLD